MDFRFTEQENEVRKLVSKVSRERFREEAFQWRFREDVPKKNLKVLGEHDILGLSFPEEYGGSGRPYLETVLAMEEIAKVCPTTAGMAMMSMAGPAAFIAKWGTREQVDAYLPPIIRGDWSISISLTEPEAGTALTDLQTNAVIKGDQCIVNGTKVFCTDAPAADLFLVFVRFGSGTGNIGAVLVRRDTPGFRLGKTQRYLSGGPWAQLYFEDATIPVSDILFTGDAFKKLMASYSLERCAAGAVLLGASQLALDLALEHVEQRKQFGKNISEFQAVQLRLAEMYIRLDAARMLIYKAISLSDNGLPTIIDSSVAKVITTEMACYVTDQAMQIFGGSGMTQDLPMEWLYRVVRGHTVAGGTNDIHRSNITAELIGRRFNFRK
ncbi:MAG: acyl-CoA dehydrogenase family protein [Bacillota bacterium]